jgi:hypothetical protein
MNERALWIGGLALGAVGVAVAVAHATSKTSSPVLAPGSVPSSNSTSTNTGGTTAPLVGPTSSGPTTVTLDPNPGGGFQQVIVYAQQKLTISLPTGASWSTKNSGRTIPPGFTETGQAFPTTGSAPVVVTNVGIPNGATSTTFSWTDSAGAAHDTIFWIYQKS